MYMYISFSMSVYNVTYAFDDVANEITVAMVQDW